MKIPKRLRRPILIIFHALRRAIGVMRHCVRRNRRGEYYVTESVVVWPTVPDPPQTTPEIPTDQLTDSPKTVSEISTDNLTDSLQMTSEIPAGDLTDSSQTPTDDLTD